MNIKDWDDLGPLCWTVRLLAGLARGTKSTSSFRFWPRLRPRFGLFTHNSGYVASSTWYRRTPGEKVTNNRPLSNADKFWSTNWGGRVRCGSMFSKFVLVQDQVLVAGRSHCAAPSVHHFPAIKMNEDSRLALEILCIMVGENVIATKLLRFSCKFNGKSNFSFSIWSCSCSYICL